MKDTFERMISWVHLDEGEYSNDPDDPGGPTRLGITIHDLRRWRKTPTLSASDVKNMREEEVKAIYRAYYWIPANGDDLPAGLDYFVFDSGLLSGVGTANRWLQLAIGGVVVDGVIGPKTLAALDGRDVREMIDKVEVLRRRRLRSLKLWSVYSLGWTNRVNKSKKRALMLLEGKDEKDIQVTA